MVQKADSFELYHYTRGFLEDIAQKGLRVLNWPKHADYVYSKIPGPSRHLFKVLIDHTQLDKLNHSVRVNRIHLTTVAEKDDPMGIAPLTSFFGGEYIRRVLCEAGNDEALEILKIIGFPLKITAVIPRGYLSEYHTNNLDTIQNGTFRAGSDTDVWVDKDIETQFMKRIDKCILPSS